MAESTGRHRASAAALMLMMACAVACVAQVWVHFNSMRDAVIYDHCDFPEGCLTSYYPELYGRLKALWAIGAILAWALVIVTALADVSRSSRMRVVGAGAIMSLWFLMTPIPWFDVGYTFHHQPADIGYLYRLGLFLLLVAAALLVWEILGGAGARASRTPDPLHEHAVSGT